MTFLVSAAIANAAIAAFETEVGTAPILKIRTGAAPATPATADSGTVLCTITLPSDWLAAPSGGSAAKSGTWQDTSADADGTAAHYRLYKSDGTTVCAQGSVTVTGGGGDMTLGSVTVTTGQQITITSWTLTANIS